MRSVCLFDRPNSVHSVYLVSIILGSTPLNEALIVMLKLVPLFKNKYKIEKMTLITLTDGGANSYSDKVVGETMTYGIQNR